MIKWQFTIELEIMVVSQNLCISLAYLRSLVWNMTICFYSAVHIYCMLQLYIDNIISDDLAETGKALSNQHMHVFKG